MSGDASSANVSVDASHFSNQDSINQSARPKELKTNSSNIDDLGRNLVALLGAPRKKESTPIQPNISFPENAAPDSAAAGETLDTAMADPLPNDSVKADEGGQDAPTDVTALMNKDPKTAAPSSVDDNPDAAPSGTVSVINDQMEEKETMAHPLSPPTDLPVESLDPLVDVALLKEAPAPHLQVALSPSAGATSPVSAHGPSPIVASTLVAHDRVQQHVGHHLETEKMADASSSSFASVVKPASPVYVLSQSFPAPILATTTAPTLGGFPASQFKASDEKSLLRNLGEAATETTTANGCGGGDKMSSSSNYVSTAPVASSTTSSSESKPLPTATPSNRFTKGRFSVLTVTETTSSPFQNGVGSSDPAMLPPQSNEQPWPQPPPPPQPMQHPHVPIIHQSQLPHQTMQHQGATNAECFGESSLPISIAAITTTTTNGESGSTASSSYVTAGMSEWERCSSSSLSPSSSAESTASGLGVVQTSESLG